MEQKQGDEQHGGGQGTENLKQMALQNKHDLSLIKKLRDTNAKITAKPTHQSARDYQTAVILGTPIDNTVRTGPKRPHGSIQVPAIFIAASSTSLNNLSPAVVLKVTVDSSTGNAFIECQGRGKISGAYKCCDLKHNWRRVKASIPALTPGDIDDGGRCFVSPTVLYE